MYRHKEYVSVGDHRLTGEVGGTLWQVGEMSGWWERPGVKRQDLSRELADGDFPTPWHYEPRYISIPGRVKACSHDALHAALDTLNGLASRSRETLSVSGHGRQMSALVQADDSPDISILNHRLADFTLHFKANDPRKLGFEHERNITGGGDAVEVSHSGNYISWPCMELDTVALSEGGLQVEFEYEDGQKRIWWYDYPIPGPYDHYLDFYRGTYVVGTTHQNFSLRRLDKCPIPPGETVRVRTYPTNSGSISGVIRWKDTWI